MHREIDETETGAHGTSAQESTMATIIARRSADIEKCLSSDPLCIGEPARNRDVWHPLSELAIASGLLERATELRNSPVSEIGEDAYLSFSRTGRREPYELLALKRRDMFRSLVLAECAEYERRNLEAIERILGSLLDDRTWVAPAHDHELRNFRGDAIEIDLYAAGLGFELALADRILGDVLSPHIRARLRAEMRRRIFDPFRAMVEGREEPAWWLSATNNWNTACLSGVVAAAQCLCNDAGERATFLAAGEFFSQHFINGFYADGYCSEGVDYWNYGVGSYLVLAEATRVATRGVIDLLARHDVKAIAEYGRRVEIAGGLYPTSADCTPGTRPDPMLLSYFAAYFDWPGSTSRSSSPPGRFRSLVEAVLWLSLLSRPDDSGSNRARPSLPVRDWFPDAGVLIARPAAHSDSTFAVFIKGGHNDEHHNHNDLGSFIVVNAQTALLTDIGAEIYTRSTFGPERYESEITSSFGHSVPRVANSLQQPGRHARAVVIQAEFSERRDVLVLNLQGAYDVPSLCLLEREFVYERVGKGSLTIRDHVKFDSPQNFETALVTLSEWTQTDAGCLEFGSGAAQVRAIVESRGACVRIDAKPVKGTIRSDHVPWRVSLAFDRLVTDAELVVIVRPCAP